LESDTASIVGDRSSEAPRVPAVRSERELFELEEFHTPNDPRPFAL
jgi:hypothetical protein